jgi:hypothetical protein
VTNLQEKVFLYLLPRMEGRQVASLIVCLYESIAFNPVIAFFGTLA